MSANQVFVITGANRGLGLGLTKSLLQRANTTVLASVRNSETTSDLKSEIENVAMGENSILHILELDFSSAISPEKIHHTLEATINHLDHIDVLICNAGFASPLTPVLSTSAEDLRQSFEVNTIAPLLVFQAFWPFLQKSSAPKVVAISSSVGSIADQEPLPGGGYGPSKAASNWLTKAIHSQHEADGLVAFALHPGWVQTRAGDFAAKEWGYPGVPPTSVEESVKGMLLVIDCATRENISGKFVTQTGDVLGW